jgi:predicted amidohydrolase
MKATVCELPDSPAEFEAQWSALARHVRDAASELVLLPDMPFCKWFAGGRRFDGATWTAAVRAHDVWERRLPELTSAFVLGTRPVDFGNARYDEAFVWDAEHGLRSVHAQAHLPDEDGARQGSWYHSATPAFIPLELEGARIGFLIGRELWAEDEARRYGEEHVDLLATPRAAGSPPFAEWLARGRQAAALARAYSLSSNRAGAFGGQGWIIAPDGEVLGLTSASEPFLSLDLELASPSIVARVDPDSLSPPLDPLETGVPPYP